MVELGHDPQPEVAQEVAHSHRLVWNSIQLTASYPTFLPLLCLMVVGMNDVLAVVAIRTFAVRRQDAQRSFWSDSSLSWASLAFNSDQLAGTSPRSRCATYCRPTKLMRHVLPAHEADAPRTAVSLESNVDLVSWHWLFVLRSRGRLQQ